MASNNGHYVIWQVEQPTLVVPHDLTAYTLQRRRDAIE
jgi:hypothetical protein